LAVGGDFERGFVPVHGRKSNNINYRFLKEIKNQFNKPITKTIPNVIKVNSPDLNANIQIDAIPKY